MSSSSKSVCKYVALGVVVTGIITLAVIIFNKVLDKKYITVSE